MIGGINALVLGRGNGKVLGMRGALIQGLWVALARILGFASFLTVHSLIGTTYIWGA